MQPVSQPKGKGIGREGCARDNPLGYRLLGYADLKRLRRIGRTEQVLSSPHGLAARGPHGPAGLDSPLSLPMSPSADIGTPSNFVFSSRRRPQSVAGTRSSFPNPLAGCALRSREGLEKTAECRLFSRVWSYDRTIPAGHAVFAALFERHLTRGPATSFNQSL